MAKTAPERIRPGQAANRSVRVGVDLLPVARMARLAAENPGIQETIFTALELRYCRGKRRATEHLAGRFAAKEAVLKALGTGLGQRMRWTDVEIVNGILGRPMVRLYGEVAARAAQLGLADLDVSLAHTSELAVAQAVAVWAGGPKRPARRRAAGR